LSTTIEPTISPWASPLITVKKKDGRTRWVMVSGFKCQHSEGHLYVEEIERDRERERERESAVPSSL